MAFPPKEQTAERLASSCGFVRSRAREGSAPRVGFVTTAVFSVNRWGAVRKRLKKRLIRKGREVRRKPHKAATLLAVGPDFQWKPAGKSTGAAGEPATPTPHQQSRHGVKRLRDRREGADRDPEVADIGPAGSTRLRQPGDQVTLDRRLTRTGEPMCLEHGRLVPQIEITAAGPISSRPSHSPKPPSAPLAVVSLRPAFTPACPGAP
jgi:hypothetical protein